MFGIVKECAEEYEKAVEKSAARGLPLNFQNVSVGYTTEVINSVAFGLKTNSISDETCEFKQIGRLIYDPGYLRYRLGLIIRDWFPFLRSVIRFSFFHPKVTQFFLKIVRDTVQYRQQTGYKRNDFLQLLINANDEQKESKEGEGKNLGNSSSRFWRGWIQWRARGLGCLCRETAYDRFYQQS